MERLQSIREQHGLSRPKAATKLGVTPNTLHRWERGWMPPVHRLRQLAALYGLTLDQVAAAIDAGRPDAVSSGHE